MRLGDYESKMSTVSPHSRQSILRYYLNYKKSGKPKIVALYNKGEWLDYSKDVVDLVKNDFERNKAIVEIRLNGRDLMLDFLHMCQMDLKTGLQQPIAWIDEAGGCFFPEIYVTPDEECLNLCDQEGMKLCIGIKVNEVDEPKLRDNSGDSNGGEDIIQNHVGLVPYTKFVQRKLHLDYVQEMFLNGMNSFGSTDFEIVETYCCSGASMQARFELFQTQVEITKEFHGNANIRYVWLHLSKGELSMMKYGLGHCALCATKCTYGVGIHLATVTCPYASARYCDIDENGVRHLVLCRVIMGNMEVLHPSIDTDTTQFQPNNYGYDNGIDDIQCPRYYIVWTMNTNTHIYPEFIVSFKVSKDAKGYFCGIVGENNDYGNNCFGENLASHGSGGLLQPHSSVNNGVVANGIASTSKIPKSPWLPFPMLIAAISDKVHASDMSLIKAHYELYKTKHIFHHDFVKELRMIVGDTILKATITSLQFKIPSNGDLEGSNKNEG